MAKHPERQAALVLHRTRWLPAAYRSRALDEWKNRETGERLKSCAMIVGEPNEFAGEIHNRMPVFLTKEQFEPWLSGEAGAEYLKQRRATSRNAGRWRSGSIARRLS